MAARGRGGRVYDEETVKRFRPLARRRFRTSRPFLVLILTRNPCVRRRRRRFGWNVRFMISDPLQRPESTRRNLDSNEASTGVSIQCPRRIWQRLSPFRRVCYSRLPCPGCPPQGAARRSATRRALGLPPKFSTTVEKNVEKPRFSPWFAGPIAVGSGFLRGEGAKQAFFRGCTHLPGVNGP